MSLLLEALCRSQEVVGANGRALVAHFRNGVSGLALISQAGC